MNGRAVAATLLAALLAAVLVVAVGPTAILASIRAASWPLVAISLAASLAFFALRGARWSLLLRPAASSARDAALMEAAGWTVSSFVPMKAGDALRIAWMARRARSTRSLVAGSVAVERALDLLGLALAATVGLGALAAIGAPGAPPWLTAVLAVAWLLPIAFVAGLVALSRLLPPQKRRGRLLRSVGTALDTLPALARTPRRLAAVAALTVLVAAAQTASCALLVAAVLPGAPLAVLAASAPLFTLTFALPLTPAHVGTYEAGFVAAFSVAGIGPAALLSAAVAAHAIGLATSALVGCAAAARLWRRPAPLAASPNPEDAPA